MSQYLEKLIQAVPGVVYQSRIDPDGRWTFSYLSDGIRELCECSPEAAYADASMIIECILEEDRQRHQSWIKQSMEKCIP